MVNIYEGLKWLTRICVFTAVVLISNACTGDTTTSETFPNEPPELAYLKEVNSWNPPTNPELLFITIGQFGAAGRYGEGIQFFENLLNRFEATITPAQRAEYLIVIALMRAEEAQNVFLIKRIGWINKTLEQLDEAKQITHDNSFIAHWASGIVRARIPSFFRQTDTALTDLLWCSNHASSAPNTGFMREVYAGLADTYRKRGEIDSANKFQKLSGYPAGKRATFFTTIFSEQKKEGHKFSDQSIKEIIPNSVYLLSGFEFSDFYFIISADKKELIAIDAGTRTDSAQKAYEALKTKVTNLPPLTTVFITHAHWDHVGGHLFFRKLNPSVKFYSRNNFADELRLDEQADPKMLSHFFGKNFQLADVLSFKPDVTVEKTMSVNVGGTEFRIIPTQGGETNDAMLIQIPADDLLFVGDVLMPYLGAPFMPEGSVDGLVASIEQIQQLNPTILLHGHAPLTRIFSNTRTLADLKPQLQWLQQQVINLMKEGFDRETIQQKNLIPPSLSASGSDVHLAYLVMRENFINRIFQQNSGYWKNGLRGLDAHTDADFGALLSGYFELTERQLISAADRLTREGNPEMAATILRWAKTQYPQSVAIEEKRKQAYVKLMEKYQEFNPFKFIIYGAEAEQSVQQININ